MKVGIVVHDQRSILTVCTPTPEVQGVKNVTVSLPRLIGRHGVEQTFPLPLSAGEGAQLKASAALIRQCIDELDRKG
jgi:L-lactate dehydrogenase